MSTRQSALFVWGGWAGHEPKQCVDVIAPIIADAGFNVEISDTLDALLDTEKLRTFDLISPAWTVGQLSPEQTAGLCGAIKNGTGIGGWHGGMGDAFRENTEYQFMTGGQFVAHPGGIIKYQVNIVDHDDPITSGLADFHIESEQYYLHTDPSNEVLATTTFNGIDAQWVKGCVMPVVWKPCWGAGRVFYSSLGHVATDFNIPQVKEITKRGLIWAAR